jgi:UDP-glucose 4-epimerase
MKKIMITGVAGLIGSRMAEWILQNQPEVQIIGIDDLSGGYMEHIPKEVEFHQMDISTANISELFKGVDIVYHFAAYAAEGLSPFIRKFNYNCNLVATANVVNACIEHQVGRLVFTSSMHVRWIYK